MTRRRFIAFMGTAAALALVSGLARAWPFSGSDKKGKEFPYTMSDKEWKEKLSPEAYNVLRQEGTERAFTSPLNDEKRPGVFYCAGCGHALYSSEQKYNSGTGWPSFWAPIAPDAVGESTDHKIGVARTEVHCSNCGGHLGHVFPDGPKPTGLRYCMNGVAMTFEPES